MTNDRFNFRETTNCEIKQLRALGEDTFFDLFQTTNKSRPEGSEIFLGQKEIY